MSDELTVIVAVVEPKGGETIRELWKRAQEEGAFGAWTLPTDAPWEMHVAVADETHVHISGAHPRITFRTLIRAARKS